MSIVRCESIVLYAIHQRRFTALMVFACYPRYDTSVLIFVDMLCFIIAVRYAIESTCCNYITQFAIVDSYFIESH